MGEAEKEHLGEPIIRLMAVRYSSSLIGQYCWADFQGRIGVPAPASRGQQKVHRSWGLCDGPLAQLAKHKQPELLR
jgi:hypothetical protein